MKGLNKIIAANRPFLERIFVLHSPSNFIDLFYYLYRRKGEKIYSRIKKKYGVDSYLVLCPYPGTGDAYIAAMNMKTYAQVHQISKIVWIVIGKPNQKIIQLFGYNNIEMISQHEMHSLVKFLLLLGVDETKILLAHPSSPYMHYGINDMMRNYGGLDFADMYSYGVFELPNTDKVHAEFACKSDYVEKIIKKNQLPKGKTVIIAPYANTLDSLPGWFWRKLVENLKNKGYCVLTNCNGTTEPVVCGTKGVFIPYKDLKLFLEYCGYFIGVRSGLCDIISSLVCKKIIIYQPYCFWGPAGNYEYFSMKKMKISEDAIELSYKGIEFLELMKQIIAQLEGEY